MNWANKWSGQRLRSPGRQNENDFGCYGPRMPIERPGRNRMGCRPGPSADYSLISGIYTVHVRSDREELGRSQKIR